MAKGNKVGAKKRKAVINWRIKRKKDQSKETSLAIY